MATYRHPLDVLASIFLCQHIELSDAELKRQLVLLNKNGLWDILAIKNAQNVLLFRYEDFYNNHDLLFDAIEAFFKIRIPDAEKTRLKNKYSLAAVKDAIGDQHDFKHYDKTTLLHGNHISKFEGRPDYHRQFFSPSQIDFLYRSLVYFIEEMGYSANAAA